MREAPSSGSARRPSDASDNMPSVPDSAHVPRSEPTRGASWKQNLFITGLTWACGAAVGVGIQIVVAFIA